MSSDDEGRRDERRERRRQRVHDRLANLIEENRMLTLLTQEDAEEVQKMRYDIETSEIEKRRLVAVNEQQDTMIRQMQDQILHLEHCKFVADVQARTIEQQDKSIKELMEENKLQAAQSQMDAETIKALHRQVNEATLERDRLATRVGKAIQTREEAEAEVKMLLIHADELRNSNVQLAAKMIALEERCQAFEEEDYADFFTRVSRRDIASGNLNGVDAQLLMIKRKGTPPTEKRLESLAAEAGITVEAMAAAELRMPAVVRVADITASHHHFPPARGIMDLSPEQLKILAQSSPSVSPKKFSAYALQSQFGISPDHKSKKNQEQKSPSSNERRDSKEFADLSQRRTDLPLPKSVHQRGSVQGITGDGDGGLSSSQQLQALVEDSDAPQELSSSTTDSSAALGASSSAAGGGKGAATRKRGMLHIISPREEELLLKQQQQQSEATPTKLAAIGGAAELRLSPTTSSSTTGAGSSSSTGAATSSSSNKTPHRSGNISPSYNYLVITPERHGGAALQGQPATAPVLQDSPPPASQAPRAAPAMELRRRAVDEDRPMHSPPPAHELRRPAPISVAADPPAIPNAARPKVQQQEGGAASSSNAGGGGGGGRSPAQNINSMDITRALPAVGGIQRKGAQQQQQHPGGGTSPQVPTIQIQPSSTNSSHHSGHNNSHNHHRRPLASLPVRDALSGSIVSGGEGVGAVDGEDDNDGVLSGVRLLSPNNLGVGDSDSSDDDDALDSPSKLSVERGTLLREQIQRQSQQQQIQQQQQQGGRRRDDATSRVLNSGGEVISSQQYAGDAKVHVMASGSTASHSKADGGGGATFKTNKELRQQRDLRPIREESNINIASNKNTQHSSSSAAPSAARVVDDSSQSGDDTMVRKQNHKSSSSAAAGPGASAKQGRNNNVNLLSGGSKFLPPIANNSMPPQSPGYLANRPSTCPLVVEAVYGERGGSTDEEKMYLVKFVSVESEQWTSASNMDPDCEPLKEWKRSKAKMRQQAQQKLAGKAAV